MVKKKIALSYFRSPLNALHSLLAFYLVIGENPLLDCGALAAVLL